jgi:hypothetical protein
MTHIQVVVLVKAAPVLTSQLDETMCVAGARVDGDRPEWIRLHPVPFRDLAVDARFAKYQTLTLEVRRPRSDRRPESWSPIEGTIELGERMGTEQRWADRRQLVSELLEADMCDLVEANRAGSGPGVPSLAVVRPAEPPRLLITERDAEQLATWHRRAEGAKNRLSLFDDGASQKPDFEVVPWRFRYEYRCGSPSCAGNHRQTIVDWEIVALWRRLRHHDDWQDRIRQKFEGELWNDRASVLFVGNQEQHPASFLVLGVFWPPASSYQPRLGL